MDSHGGSGGEKGGQRVRRINWSRLREESIMAVAAKVLVRVFGLGSDGG